MFYYKPKNKKMKKKLIISILTVVIITINFQLQSQDRVIGNNYEGVYCHFQEKAQKKELRDIFFNFSEFVGEHPRNYVNNDNVKLNRYLRKNAYHFYYNGDLYAVSYAPLKEKIERYEINVAVERDVFLYRWCNKHLKFYKASNKIRTDWYEIVDRGNYLFAYNVHHHRPVGMWNDFGESGYNYDLGGHIKSLGNNRFELKLIIRKPKSSSTRAIDYYEEYHILNLIDDKFFDVEKLLKIKLCYD